MWDLRTLAQLQGSEMFPGLFQDFVDGYIKPEGSCKLADEDRVAVMTVGSQS